MSVPWNSSLSCDPNLKKSTVTSLSQHLVINGMQVVVICLVAQLCIKSKFNRHKKDKNDVEVCQKCTKILDEACEDADNKIQRPLDKSLFHWFSPNGATFYNNKIRMLIIAASSVSSLSCREELKSKGTKTRFSSLPAHRSTIPMTAFDWQGTYDFLLVQFSLILS